jgi:hypothetical protein
MGSMDGLLTNMVCAPVGPATGSASDSGEPQLSFQDMLACFLLEPELFDCKRGDKVNEELCLISHEPLGKQRVKLPCGHSFNYAHIYAEVERQKRGRRVNDWPRVGDYAMKCPYCNVIHNGLLPPCEGYPVVANVNSPIKWSLAMSPCEHVFIKGKRIGQMCGAKVMCGEIRCKQHQKCEESTAAAAKSLCMHIFARGKRTGQQCGKRSAPGRTRCVRHQGCKQALVAADGVNAQTI